LPAAPKGTSDAAGFKDALLAEIRKAKKYLYGTVVAQAQRIDVSGDRITFTFTPVQSALRAQLEQNRPWLESLASELAGRRMTVASDQAATPGSATPPEKVTVPPDDRKARLRAEALADEGVQAMLDVFKTEIRDVEEM
jgi:hypothetical protein